MELKSYNLNIRKKKLLENVNIEFFEGQINHILGKNGVGKSVFAKEMFLSNENIIVIGSYSNLPDDITMDELTGFLIKKIDKSKVEHLCKLLNTENIGSNTILKKLSDGQRQKLKILVFFLLDKDIIILDEITNALDKATSNEIYSFLNLYIKNNPNKMILNITHNLSDLNNMEGNYFLFDNYNITRFEDKEELINMYIKGGI